MEDKLKAAALKKSAEQELASLEKQRQQLPQLEQERAAVQAKVCGCAWTGMQLGCWQVEAVTQLGQTIAAQSQQLSAMKQEALQMHHAAQASVQQSEQARKQLEIDLANCDTQKRDAQKLLAASGSEREFLRRERVRLDEEKMSLAHQKEELRQQARREQLEVVAHTVVWAVV